MIRIMKNSDLTQCGSIYTKAFPMEYWGIDWTTENATEYLQDFLNREDLWDLYMRKIKKYWGVYSHFVRFQATKKRFCE